MTLIYWGMNEKRFAVYVLASHRNGTLYVGVTSDLAKRVWEHRNGVTEGFTKKHGIKNLVWFELRECAESAITREKQIKKWNRNWKLELIQASNPYWHDLWTEIAV